MEKRLNRLCSILLIALFLSVNSAFAQSDIAAKWVTLAPLPIARGETAAATIGDRIYVAAGFNGSLSPTKEMFVYTPAKNTWQTSTPLPVGLHHVGMAAVNQKLYVMGGVLNGLGGPHPNGAEWTGSTTALEYDPSTSTWKSLKPLPHSTAASGVVGFGGKVYVIGGIDADGIVLDLVQEYDPALDTWSNKLPMPTKREHVGIAVLDSLIYVVSGRVSDQSFKKFEAYSPASNRWYALPDMPTARSDIGFAQAKGKLYAMGGEKPGIFDANEEYNPGTRTWKSVLKMTGTRKAVSAVAFHDSIFVFGGFTANGLTTLVEVFVAPGPLTVMNLSKIKAISRLRFGRNGQPFISERNLLGKIRYRDQKFAEIF